MSAQVEIGLSDKELRAGLAGVNGLLRKLESDTKSLSGGFKAMASNIAGLFGGGVVIGQARAFIGELARVQDLADRFGETAETIQSVGNAAKLSGSDVETLAKTMGKLTIAAGTSAEKFEAIGISAAKFASASLDQKVIMLAEAYERASEDQTKMVSLMDLLGNRGAEIFPLLAQGVVELKKQLKELPKVGNETVKMLGEADDAIDKTGIYLKVFVGTHLSRAVKFAQFYGDVWRATFKTFKENGSFVNNLIDAQNAREEANAPKKPAKPFDPEAFAEAHKSAKDTAAETDKSASAYDDLGATQARIAEKRMSDEEKLLAMEGRWWDLQAQIDNQELPEEKRVKAMEKAVELQAEMEDLQDRIDAAQAKADADHIAAIDAETAAAQAKVEAEQQAAETARQAAEAAKKEQARARADALTTQISGIMGDLESLDSESSTRPDGRKRIRGYSSRQGGADAARARAEHNVAFARERIAARTAVAFGAASPSQAILDRTLARGGTEKQAREAQMLPVLQQQLEYLKRLAE